MKSNWDESTLNLVEDFFIYIIDWNELKKKDARIYIDAMNPKAHIDDRHSQCMHALAGRAFLLTRGCTYYIIDIKARGL